MEDTQYWVYILLCQNNAYYTGYTNNLIKRWEAHQTGKASKYTRSFKPIKIAQFWHIQGNKALAMQLERNIKKLSKLEKEKIIIHPTTLSIHAYPGNLNNINVVT